MNISEVRVDGLFKALTEIIPGTPEVIGWCDLTVDGKQKTALVVGPAWPRGLP